MREIVETIAHALVDQPDLVSVAEIGGMHTSIREPGLAKADVGKVIGKQGPTAGALRTILSGISPRTRKRTVLKIVE